MGKIIEKVRLQSLFDPARSIEVDALIDTDATMFVLPQDLVDKLELRKIREVIVKYANNQTRERSVYAGLVAELKGRIGNFEAVAEVPGSEPLVGQIVLEALDLVIDPGRRTLVPNPRSPDMPMVEALYRS
jgi:predicted aspartyl protease